MIYFNSYLNYDLEISNYKTEFVFRHKLYFIFNLLYDFEFSNYKTEFLYTFILDLSWKKCYLLQKALSHVSFVGSV